MDLAIFFNGPKGVKATLFGKGMTSSQVQGCQRIIAAHDLYGYGLDTALAYFLATSFHETGKRMQPIREANGTSTADTIRRLDKAWAAGKLTWVKTPYWRGGWFGRGDVQLTHEDNYSGAMRDAVLEAFPGCDIHADPDLALRPDISAFIMIEGMTKGHTLRADFTGKALETFINAGKTDYRNARQTVNPGDKPTYSSIAVYASKIENAIRAAREAAGEEFQDGKHGKSAVGIPVSMMASRSLSAGETAMVLAAPAPADDDAYPDSLYDGTPNDTVKRVQELLQPMYPEIGEADGEWGEKTEAWVLAFRSKRKLPLTATIDDAFLAELAKPTDRAISVARATATASSDTLKNKPVIAEALQGISGAKLLTFGAGALGIGNGAMTLSDMNDKLNQAQALYQSAMHALPLLGIAAVAAGGWYILHRIKEKQVENYRTAKLS